jgi:hypothetical protein
MKTKHKLKFVTCGERNGRTVLFAIDESGDLWEFSYGTSTWTFIGQPES